MKIVFRRLKFIFRQEWYSLARWEEYKIIDCGFFSIIFFKIKFVGWSTPQQCIDFPLWLKWDYRFQDGWFHRLLGFEWKEINKSGY